MNNPRTVLLCCALTLLAGCRQTTAPELGISASGPAPVLAASILSGPISASAVATLEELVVTVNGPHAVGLNGSGADAWLAQLHLDTDQLPPREFGSGDYVARVVEADGSGTFPIRTTADQDPDPAAMGWGHITGYGHIQATADMQVQLVVPLAALGQDDGAMDVRVYLLDQETALVWYHDYTTTPALVAARPRVR